MVIWPVIQTCSATYYRKWKGQHKKERNILDPSENSEQTSKNAVNQNYYMQIQVKSIGQHKARGEAVFQLKRNVNILKFVYDMQNYQHLFQSPSPFDYCCEVDKIGFIDSELATEFSRSPIIGRQDIFDKISEINEITNNPNREDIDNRILNAIDVFGMIEDSMPLNVRFMLCTIALEGLLLSDDDKDYLNWKLAEKLTFLLGIGSYGFILAFDIEPNNRAILTEEYMARNLVESRIRLTLHTEGLKERKAMKRYIWMTII